MDDPLLCNVGKLAYFFIAAEVLGTGKYKQLLVIQFRYLSNIHRTFIGTYYTESVDANMIAQKSFINTVINVHYRVVLSWPRRSISHF